MLLRHALQLGQCVLAKDLGVWLGTINFVSNTLVEESLVKKHNFSLSENKLCDAC